jgi:hypothetical protein
MSSAPVGREIHGRRQATSGRLPAAFLHGSARTRASLSQNDFFYLESCFSPLEYSIIHVKLMYFNTN